MEASSIVGTVGGLGSMIPVVGPIISTGASIVSGILKNQESQDQAARAAQLRQKSERLQKQALRPEYSNALKADQMAALYGLPGYNQYIEDIDEGIANSARAIQESSPNGAATLATISAALTKANQAKNELFLKDSLMQQEKQQRATDRLWSTGDKQMDLISMLRSDKRDLNQGAMNLENAATANKIGSLDQILASIGAGANALSKAGQDNVTSSGLPVATQSTAQQFGGLDNAFKASQSGLDADTYAALVKLQKAGLLTNPSVNNYSFQTGI